MTWGVVEWWRGVVECEERVVQRGICMLLLQVLSSTYLKYHVLMLRCCDLHASTRGGEGAAAQEKSRKRREDILAHRTMYVGHVLSCRSQQKKYNHAR